MAVGCYIPPAITSKIDLIATYLGYCPNRVDPILTRYINVELAHPEGR